MNEISQRTWWLLAAAVISVMVVAAFAQAGELGFWEPFESMTVRVGAEVAQADPVGAESADVETASEAGEDEADAAGLESPAVPTLDGESVQVSWLKAMWVSRIVDDRPVAEAGGIGSLERRTRLPLLALALLLFGAVALWLRRHVGDGPAAMTAVVLATSPVIYLGALLLSGPLVYVAASALSVIAFFQAVYGSERWRLPWAVAGGAALALVALDERVVGVYATVAVLVGWALAESVAKDPPPCDGDDGKEKPGDAGLDVMWALGGAGLFLLALGWGWFISLGYEDGLFRPEVAHRVWMVAPPALMVGVAAACRSPVGRALTDFRGLLYAAGGAIPLVVVGTTYAGAASVDPALADETSPTLTYLLESQAVGGDVAADGNFSWWWRQVGFGFFPHLMLLVPAVGYLAWKVRPDADISPRVRAVATLCLVWPVAAFGVMAPAAHLGHTAYPAFVPLMVAVGWMVGDERFWNTLRLRPAIYLCIAVIALFTVLVLSGDMEEFSSRIVEFALGGIEDPDFAENFAPGAALDVWKRAMMVGLVAYFAGAISWLVFAWRDGKRLWGWVTGLRRRAVQWWQRWRGDDDGVKKAVDSPATPGADGADDVPPGSSGQRRMAAREAWRDEDGTLSRIARRVERLPGLVALVTAGGLGFMAATMGWFVDDLDTEVSSRAVLENYLDSAGDGDALWTYEIDEDPRHFYVRGLDEISNRREFNERFEDDEQRFFALIPADQLAEIHSRVRRDHERNLPVLAGGGGMYLVTNQLLDGEEDVNPLSEFILDEPDDDYIPLLVEVDGEEQHPVFSRQIEFLGYRFDRGSKDEPPVYRWGDTMEVTMYFGVERRVPRSQEVFMHVDLAGNRLHGDHIPVGGQYPTNHWVPGDVIKDVHEIEIERFSTPGIYTIWTGFYRGDDRMNVDPDEAHDGQDRVNMATIEVVPF